MMHILTQKEYKSGDMPPDGYLAWHEWAEVQRKAGIKQVSCGRCGLWKTPQELSGEIITMNARNKRGDTVKIESPVCIKCVKPNVELRGCALLRSPA